MGEVTNIIHKAVNDNFKEPLDELIKRTNSEVENAISNKSGVLKINPAFPNDFSYYIEDRGCFSSDKENIVTEERTSKVFTEEIKGRELWCTQWGTLPYELFTIDLVTGVRTTKAELLTTFKDNQSPGWAESGILVVTETYVYGYERTADTTCYLFRYNKLTGEYKRSDVAITDKILGYCSSEYLSKVCYIAHGDDLYLYSHNSSSSSAYGFYKLEDAIDSGGTFTTTLIKSESQSYQGINTQSIKLSDSCSLVSSSYLGVRKLNVETGELSDALVTVSSNNDILCPIEHEGKLVGALVGNPASKLYIVRINGEDVSVIEDIVLYTSHSITNSSNVPVVYAWYEDGILYTTKYYNASSVSDGEGGFDKTFTLDKIKDANLYYLNDNMLAYIPKGTRFYSMATDKILKVTPKLRDALRVNEDGVLECDYVYRDENYMFEFPEDGLYSIPIYSKVTNTYAGAGILWYFLGTFV